jgi:SAM-dependent methyltransferase
MSSAPDISATAERITRWLRCPSSHELLSVSNGEIFCPTSNFRGMIRDDVAIMLTEISESFFDDKFHVMKHGKENAGEWSFCYAKQTELLSASLKPDTLVLDVGCGPVLPYRKPDGVHIIGLEPSFHSIRVNHQVDLRVFGTAYSMPIKDASIDTLVCFYAVHHMVGNTIRATIANVSRAFAEFGRVLKPGGSLLVFEMSPVPFYSISQRLFWNGLKRILGRRLDMHFFTAKQMESIGSKTLPVGAGFEIVAFKTSAFTTFAPLFSIPRFKVPRFVYPLGSKLYKWQMPSA